MSLNICPNLVEFSGRETVIGAQRDGFQPELADHSFTSHMHVRWFIAVETVEEESIGTRDIFDSRHMWGAQVHFVLLYTLL